MLSLDFMADIFNPILTHLTFPFTLSHFISRLDTAHSSLKIVQLLMEEKEKKGKEKTRSEKLTRGGAQPYTWWWFGCSYLCMLKFLPMKRNRRLGPGRPSP